jgi:hypothetical protein
MLNIEKKMQEFIPGIVSLDDPGPELRYYVSPEGEVTTLVRFPDGSQARGVDASGTLLALIGELPKPGGWFSASGKPISAPLGL